MPPRRDRAAFTAAVPIANDAITYLREQDQPRLADAVETILVFGAISADAVARKAALDTTSMPSQSIQVSKELYDRVQGTNYAELVREKLDAFWEGEWTPDKPKRAPRGQEKAWLNIRIPADLWDQVNARAKDPALSEERGYKLNARQVVIAALRDEFPPEPEPVADEVTAE
ncbi:hypothetical protein ACWEWX_27375 [Streptomyces asiaticus]